MFRVTIVDVVLSIFFFLHLRTGVSFAVGPSSQGSKITSDVAVVGCGVLGTSLCKQLLLNSKFQSMSGSSISYSLTGITKTTNRHQSIRDAIGSSASNDIFDLITYETTPQAIQQRKKKFCNVVFCAPPSGFEDYADAVKDAMDNIWAGPNSGGTFVFTSSGGIYGPGDGENVTETTPIPPPTSSRSVRLNDAEQVCLSQKNTAVLRLAGLYTLERGAHNYWLERGKVSGEEDAIINLLHYDDAAGACIAALLRTSDEDDMKVFLVSDGSPTTRKEICESALKSKKFSGMQMPVFEGGRHCKKGKVYDGSRTNSALKWTPRYSSFDEFMCNS